MTTERYKSAADGVELLLKAGANVDAKDSRGRTPLDWAAYPTTKRKRKGENNMIYFVDYVIDIWEIFQWRLC